ncbi:MAG TPA: hypothetical protein VK348_06875 [Planctomycetota bacterium]|nr:hypothetical protein [Planctomycetota bacterium]
MNCRICQFELSQCLDGRLPSGRRTLVMQHAAGCAGCASFWSELQAAQQLVLRLRQPHVSGEFRERLFERIRAGEGTPEAVFHEPVPMATKIRYVLSGAAAAAAVLVAASLWQKDAPRSAPPGRPTESRPTESRPTESQPTDIAKTDAAPHRGHDGNGLVPRVDPNAALAGFAPSQLTTDLWARETARQFKGNFDNARRFAGSLAAAPVVQPDSPAVRVLHENALGAKRLGAVLLELQDNYQRVDLGNLHHDLRFLIDQLDPLLLQERSPDAARRMATLLDGVRNLANLPDEMAVIGRASDNDAADPVVVRLCSTRPEVFKMLFMQLPADPDATGFLPDPRQRSNVFTFGTECGQVWVVRRSVAAQHELRLQVMFQSQDGQIRIQAAAGNDRDKPN